MHKSLHKVYINVVIANILLYQIGRYDFHKPRYEILNISLEISAAYEKISNISLSEGLRTFLPSFACHDVTIAVILHHILSL